MEDNKYGPKSVDHPSIGKICLICSEPFLEGDYTSLVSTQPASEEDRIRMIQGRPYTSEAEEVHYNCYVSVHGK